MRENRILALTKGKEIPIIVILIAFLSCGYTVWKYIDWQQTATRIQEPEKRIQAERETFSTLTQVLGGTFVLISLYFTARTIQISHETRITNSFFQAMELLGDKDSLSKRIGGIYALERIAWDSEKDHWTIMEVFMSYARQYTAIDVYKEKDSPTSLRTPEDIHAVIRAISRRKRIYEKGEEHALDLRNLYLVSADFFCGHLQGVLLDGSILDKASFKWANLDKARLRKTSLRGANFTNASLRQSKLADADLTDAVLTNAHLEGTNLSDTVGLTNSQIESAIISPETRLPAYLQLRTKD